MIAHRLPSRTVIVASLIAVLALLGAGAADAHWAAPIVAPRVTRARVCGDVLVVGFDAAALLGHRWAPLPDDGRAVLQAHEAFRPGDGEAAWGAAPGRVVPGGEGVLRWDWPEGVRYDQVRVVVQGFTSVPAPIEMGCVS